MTEQQKAFLEVVKLYEKTKSEFKCLTEQLEFALTFLPIGGYFQDPETLAVYHIVVPKGKFVSFDKLSYERTALKGESRGSMSRKEAEEKGFDLGR